MKYWKSQYSESRYFTPPRVAPINLDLAFLDGGGYAPSQFEGETLDGRHVYCRYRGGVLSVTVANEPGVDALAQGADVLRVQIGPPLHGGMTLGQLCHCAGITINGSRPSYPTLNEIYEASSDDLSGARTFFSAWLNSSYLTQKRFIVSALETFPDMTLVQPNFENEGGNHEIKNWSICECVEDLTSDQSYMLFGQRPTEVVLEKFKKDGLFEGSDQNGLVVRVSTSGFQYSIYKYANRDAERVHDATGKKIFVAGQTDDCLYGTFSLISSFGIDDDGRRALIARLDSLLDAFFPRYQVVHYDLVSGAREEIEGFCMHFDPEIVAWVDGSGDRWLRVENAGDFGAPRYVGVKAFEVSDIPSAN